MYPALIGPPGAPPYHIEVPKPFLFAPQHPTFVVNWISHVVPTLVDDSSGYPRFPPAVMQFINDVKRTITKNQDDVEGDAMQLCEKIFIKNSIDHFGDFML